MLSLTSEMWLFAILFLLAGAVLADPQNGWENGKEFTYKIRSRTLAAINPQSKEYTGILMKAYLTVQPNGPEILRAKIFQPRYSQVHTRLENGWDSEIPENQINLQDYPFSDQPFEIKVKNGIIKNLIVDKNMPTWELNVLKSIVSQLQIDTLGENAKISKYNQFPEEDQPNALFKVMEDSVTGKCEVLYDISPLQERVLQNKPELAPMLDLSEDGEIISIVKTKNYSNCEQRICYHYGFNGDNNWEPGSNDNGRYLSRSSMSRIVISGNLRKYTVQSSVTTNKVVLNPDQQANRQGMLASRMNLTLHEIKDIIEPLTAPPNPESIGNLVYHYNSPSDKPSSRRPNKLNQRLKSDDVKYDFYSGEKMWHSKQQKHDENESDSSFDSSDSTYDNDNDNYLQIEPKLNEAPNIPMLSYFIGNHGISIQKNDQIDILNSVNKISRDIGNEIQKPDSMLDKETLDKFTILIKLIRIMNAEQISNAQRDLYQEKNTSNQPNSNQGQSARKNAWVAFRDAVAQAGTGPALVNIKRWIENKQIQGQEAANIFSVVADSAQTPTPEYMNAFFEMATIIETKKQGVVRDAAILSFAELIRHAVVNKRSAHNRYPVHTFGRFYSKNFQNLHEKFIPYIAEELKTAISIGDSKKIQVYSIALGRIGHPRALSIFEPYLEGRKSVSPYQRLVMVLSLHKVASIYPSHVRSVLYKIYSNTADYHEIRTAAVFLLMKTNPSASILQRMAEFTNYDSNKHVSSAVKSTIESLAKLRGNKARDLSNAAKAALPLLTSESFGLQYSRGFIRNFENYETHSEFSLVANYIGSDDSIIPKAGFITVEPTYNGLKVPKIMFGGSVTSIQNVWNFIQQKLNNFEKTSKSNLKAQQKTYSPENIAKVLGIHGKEPEQVEGFAFMYAGKDNYFLPFDNHSLEQIPEFLDDLNKAMKKGKDFEEVQFSNSEVILSFPTDTGYPFTFTLEIPKVLSLMGHYKSKLEFESDNHATLPKNATIFGTTRLVYGMKIQKRLGFVVPFEHRKYIVGIDRNIQLYLPLRSEIEYDKNKQEARIKLQSDENESEYKILQCATYPFTSQHNILNLQPVSNDNSTHIIRKDRAVTSQVEFNDKASKHRLQFTWEKRKDISSERNESSKNKYEKVIEAASELAYSIGSLYHPNIPDKTDYEKYSIRISPDSNASAEIRLSYNSSITENNNVADNSENWAPNVVTPYLDKGLNKHERQEKMLKEVSKNVNSAQAKAVDLSLQLNGSIRLSLVMTGAFGKSNVDEKSRALFYGYTNIDDGQDYHLSAGFEGKTPDVQTLDYEETLKANNRREYDVKVHYGTSNDENTEYHSKIEIQGKMEQTDDRKNQIRQSLDAKACSTQENQSGNKMTLACTNVKNRAASIDKGDFVITFENEKALKQIAMDALDLAESLTQKRVETHKTRYDTEEKNKIKISFDMSPDDEQLDISVKTPEGKVQFNNIQWNNKNNMYSTTKKDGDYQQTELSLAQDNVCYLDKSQVRTFDNHHYNLKLGQCWHVAMTSYPKNDPDRPGQEQEVPENMHVTILTKENKNGQKELKITIGEKEIELSPSKHHEIVVEINGKNIRLSKTQSYQEKQDGQLIFELFELFDKSIKFVSDKFSVRVVYDGQRAQIEAGERYRNSVRGLCGNDDGEPDNDQQSPKGCFLKKPELFSASYALINVDNCSGSARKNAEKAEKAVCIFDFTRPGNVISEQEAGRNPRNTKLNSSAGSARDCTRHRTKVIRSDNEICFSLRPLPVCLPKCSPSAMKSKNIQFHCVARTSVSEKVAERVEKGANPDLTQKTVSKTESYDIPISCKA